MANRIILRRDTASAWTVANPILANGEIGLETDTERFKIGNGTDPWDERAYYANADFITAAVQDVLDEALEQIDDAVAIAETIRGQQTTLLSQTETARNQAQASATLAGNTTDSLVANAVNTPSSLTRGGLDLNYGANTTKVLTNKTITLGTNTITGTLAQFNTALTDDNFLTAGTLGVWQGYDPQVDVATTFAVSADFSPTVTRYAQIGKIVHVVVVGGLNIAGGSTWTFRLPVQPLNPIGQFGCWIASEQFALTNTAVGPTSTLCTAQAYGTGGSGGGNAQLVSIRLTYEAI